MIVTSQYISHLHSDQFFTLHGWPFFLRRPRPVEARKSAEGWKVLADYVSVRWLSAEAWRGASWNNNSGFRQKQKKEAAEVQERREESEKGEVRKKPHTGRRIRLAFTFLVAAGAIAGVVWVLSRSGSVDRGKSISGARVTEAKRRGASPGVPAGSAPVTEKPRTSPETGMEFIWIRTLGLWAGKYEVTNGEYRRKVSDHDSKAFKGHSLNGDRQPVVYVNFQDAKAYAEWLTERDRASGKLSTGYRYRLPTEQEWMVLAQCGDGRDYPWGKTWPPRSGHAGNYHGEEGAGPWSKLAEYRDGHAVACDVEQSWANSWGLYGVGGNAWELCASDKNRASFGAWRGASWGGLNQGTLRCSCRLAHGGVARHARGGFRLLLSR